MQPSRDSSAVRRFGPVIAIAVLAAVVIVAVVASSGGDDDTDTKGSSSSSSSSDTTAAAISFSEAKDKNLDVTFQDSCDEETGRVAIPFYFAPECYANVDDNGGATSKGVTADTITVVAYVAPDDDALLDYITGPITNDDTAKESADTIQGYFDMFNALYQTYGRKVELKILNGSGGSSDETAARADAVKATEQMGAFAVLGQPALAGNAWTQEIVAHKVLCIGCSGTQEFLEKNAPYVFAGGPSGQQVAVHATEYISKKLKGKNAEFGGDAVKSKPRVFGHVYAATAASSDPQDNAAKFKERLHKAGVELAAQVSYSLDDVSKLGEEMQRVISKLKEANVTSVILQSDPIAPKPLTEEATAQQYFPEWVLAGGVLDDTTAFGRVFDQSQWRHMFGVSSLSARTDPNKAIWATLYQWFHHEAPPAPDTAPVLLGAPALLFSGIQTAGPALTPTSFRDGLFAQPLQKPALTQPLVSYGDKGLWDFTKADYSSVDDMTEIWWDPDETGPDEINKDGKGMVRWVDGGKRYLPGQWTTDLKVFQKEGSVAIYPEPPASETPKDYPSPS